MLRSKSLEWRKVVTLPDMHREDSGRLRALVVGAVADTIRKEGWDAYTASRPGFATWLEERISSHGLCWNYCVDWPILRCLDKQSVLELCRLHFEGEREGKHTSRRRWNIERADGRYRS